jgi:hypothetical protein
VSHDAARTASYPVSNARALPDAIPTFRARVLDRRDRGGAGVARREHRVEHDRVPLGEIVGELHVVLDRLERLLVAVHAHEADARTGDQRERPLEHAHARPQHRADGDLLAGDARRVHPLERRLDLDVLDREVLRRLVRQQERDLLDELAEVDRRRVLVPQVRELVLDERVRDVGQPTLRGDGLGHAT